jgi:LysM repeat protein
MSPLGTLTPANTGKSNVRIAVITIIALHAVFFGGLLLQGCKPKSSDLPLTGAGGGGSGGAGGGGSGSGAGTEQLPPFAPTNVAGFGADTNRGYAAQPTQPAGSNATAVPYTPPYVPPAENVIQPVQPAVAAQEYVIKAKDTPAKVAKAHGVSLNALLSANPGLEPRKLKIGQKIQIPAPTPATGAAGAGGGTVGGTEPGAEAPKVHVVKQGETLTRIAQSYGMKVKELRAANKLKTDRINVGQKIKIPAGKAGAAGAATTTHAMAPAGGAAAR